MVFQAIHHGSRHFLTSFFVLSTNLTLLQLLLPLYFPIHLPQEFVLVVLPARESLSQDIHMTLSAPSFLLECCYNIILSVWPSLQTL
jgi:hypothetical protein